jgi:hypothetical protein
MKQFCFYRSTLSVGFLVFVLAVLFSCVEKNNQQTDELVGAWKGKVQFRTGAFAEIKDFEFMWVYNSGGTMTESSNYDGVPPTPPAYGIWKKTGDKQYEARYEFYWNKVPASYEELIKAGGFSNAGYGVLLEKITLSDDGKSYGSTIKLNLFDQTGKQFAIDDEATAEAKRMEFSAGMK